MSFSLLPPAPGKCQECATIHLPEEPHNNDSLFYKYHFHGRRGRWPTWKDAVAHCDPATREAWEAALRERGAWTEPETDVPDVMPCEDGTIGNMTRIPLGGE